MIFAVTEPDRYVEPVVITLIGAGALAGAVFFVWLGVRRKSVWLAVRGVGGLIVGTVLLLWGIGVAEDPFGDALFLVPLALSLLLIVAGSRLGRQPEERRRPPRRTQREILSDVGLVAATLLALFVIFWVVPQGYSSTATLGLLVLIIVATIQRHRWKRRRQAREKESAAKD